MTDNCTNTILQRQGDHVGCAPANAADPIYCTFPKSSQTASDLQIGPQKIPGPEMVILPVSKEWNELKKLGDGFKHLSSFITQQSLHLNVLYAIFITLTMQ